MLLKPSKKKISWLKGPFFREEKFENSFVAERYQKYL